jgi:signal peptidase II
MRKYAAPLATALALALGLDLVTKAWAESTLYRHAPVKVVGEWFRLTLGYNEGIAFGLFATDGPGVIIASGVATLLIALWVVHALRMDSESVPAPWALGLLLGGGIANLIDRIGDGRVTDFLDVGFGPHRWPTFNIADIAILTGVALLLAWSYRRPAADDASVQPSTP